MATDTEVLVCGAGPTGLTMAAELLRRGVATRVVDRAPRAQPHAKAVILWPRALEVLARLDAVDRIRELSVPVTAANYYTGARRIASIKFSELYGCRFSTPVSIPQHDTEEVLREVLEELGGSVEFDQEVKSVLPGPENIEVEISGNPTSVSWVAGCDGAHSVIRSTVGVPFTGATYPQSFALVDGTWDTPLAHNESHYFMSANGVLVVVGLPGCRYRAFVSLPSTDVGDVIETVCELATERCPVPMRLAAAEGSGVFTIHRRMANRFRSGRVLLAGDAAHVHSPAGGQGLNTSIQDAHEAAWRLAGVVHGRLPDRVLDQWERERRHVATAVIDETDRQTRLWTVRGWRKGVRDTMIAAASTTGMLNRAVPPRLAQLTLRYPSEDGALSGTRLPDVRLPTGGWLHDRLRDGRHLLLVLPDRTGPRAARWAERYRDRDTTVLVTTSAVVRKTLGLRRSSAVLVRPDGVIAASGKLSDAALHTVNYPLRRFQDEYRAATGQGQARPARDVHHRPRLHGHG